MELAKTPKIPQANLEEMAKKTFRSSMNREIHSISLQKLFFLHLLTNLFFLDVVEPYKQLQELLLSNKTKSKDSKELDLCDPLRKF